MWRREGGESESLAHFLFTSWMLTFLSGQCKFLSPSCLWMRWWHVKAGLMWWEGWVREKKREKERESKGEYFKKMKEFLLPFSSLSLSLFLSYQLLPILSHSLHFLHVSALAHSLNTYTHTFIISHTHTISHTPTHSHTHPLTHTPAHTHTRTHSFFSEASWVCVCVVCVVRFNLTTYIEFFLSKSW